MRPAIAIPGALLRGVAIVLLVAGSLLGSAASSPALAADDGLSLTSTSSYVLVPDKGLVHVTVDVTATNNKPDLVQGSGRTIFFYDAAAIVIHAEAKAIRASAGKTRLATKVTAQDGFSVLRVTFLNDLQYKKSTKFRVEYDLPGGAPRSASEIRVGSAFATFYAWAFGDRGDVRIVIPAGFEVETTGSTVEKSVKAGVTTLAATGIGNPNAWYSVVVADRHDALSQERIDLAGGEHLVIRAWPEDTEWRTRVGDLLRIGLPVLVDRLGLDWPVPGDIEVAEVHTPLLEGYGGVFYPNEDRIEISEDLDNLTIIHEASHAWFNSKLFVGRWISEGFADEYASRVLDEVSDGGLKPDPVTPTSEGAVDLNTWTHPGRIDDDETDRREQFGYDASWTVIRGLIGEIGEDRMRAVLAAADADETAYVGAPEPESVTVQNDWRRFLDLLESIGGSRTAEDVFRRWVVAPNDEPLLDARADARSAYAALVEAGKGWQPGFAVRDPMGRWTFATATAAIADSTEILGIRDRIVAGAAELGVTPPTSLRAAYEAATNDLAGVRALADAQLATVTALDAAADHAAAERDLFTSIGLIGEDPAASIAAANAAFAAGDTAAADAASAAVESLLADAPDAGRSRTLAAGLAGAGVVGVGFAGIAAMRRRRRRRTGAAGPYATLGAPRPGDAAADGPAEPGRVEGDDT